MDPRCRRFVEALLSQPSIPFTLVDTMVVSHSSAPVADREG
jgi:hypothetical protein